MAAAARGECRHCLPRRVQLCGERSSPMHWTRWTPWPPRPVGRRPLRWLAGWLCSSTAWPKQLLSQAASVLPQRDKVEQRRPRRPRSPLFSQFKGECGCHPLAPLSTGVCPERAPPHLPARMEGGGCVSFRVAPESRIRVTRTREASTEREGSVLSAKRRRNAQDVPIQQIHDDLLAEQPGTTCKCNVLMH